MQCSAEEGLCSSVLGDKVERETEYVIDRSVVGHQRSWVRCLVADKIIRFIFWSGRLHVMLLFKR
jgi:hypothetical protein